MSDHHTHLVLIHQVYAGKNDPGGTRHYELLSRFVRRPGNSATVITADSNYLEGRRSDALREDQDGVSVLRTRTFGGHNRSYTGRILSFLGFMVSSVFVGLRTRHVDVVMGTSPPLPQAVSAWLLSALKGVPFLLEIRDLWPEFAIDIGVLKNRQIIWASRKLEMFLYRRADHLLVNSPAYRDYLVGKGVAAEKISFVSNGVDAGMFDPAATGTEFRQKYGVEGKFLAIYAGAMGMANDLDTLLAAAEKLRGESRIHVMVVGDGKERPRLEEKAKSLGLTNITFTGAVPKSQMSTVVAAADVCLAILKNIPMFTTTYPNKVFDYMAAGRPTVLAIDGVIRKVIEDAQAGTFVPPGDAEALANAVRGYAQDPGWGRTEGENGRAFVIEHFNRDQQAQIFAELVESVAAGSVTAVSTAPTL